MVHLSYWQVMIQLTWILSCMGTPPAISVCTYYLYCVMELMQWHCSCIAVASSEIALNFAINFFIKCVVLWYLLLAGVLILCIVFTSINCLSLQCCNS